MIISDGAGTNYEMKVGLDHRAHVDAVTFGKSEIEVERGNGYNVNTGAITLTDATPTSVLYVKTNEDKPVIITALFYMTGVSTGGSGDQIITVYKNPTAGSIITNAVDAEMPAVNRNFGSSKTFDGNVYKGATADNDFTDGDKVIESLLNASSKRTVLAVGDIVMPKGSSLGISITPPAGNTSMQVEFAISMFIDSLSEEK